jgi:hypothetical protein
MRYQVDVVNEWGNATGFLELIRKTEEEAREAAAALLENYPVELWDGPRRIALFTPKDWLSFQR